ncbi:helix-turn-helix domain-containing protein [Photorhabdus akhurstii]|uniref:helix-turn-helix domain-containing protein n=1 Tax=Photorhabdus akhurstii TaxID=171438 RepID=UPI0037048A3C
MKITLTDAQKDSLKLMYDTTRDGRVRDRIKAVLLAHEGWIAQMIAQALRIHESTVICHLKKNSPLKMAVLKAVCLPNKPQN